MTLGWIVSWFETNDHCNACDGTHVLLDFVPDTGLLRGEGVLVFHNFGVVLEVGLEAQKLDLEEIVAKL